MTHPLHGEHNKWMKSQGWEVAIIQCCRETGKITNIGYRWVGPPEETPLTQPDEDPACHSCSRKSFASCSPLMKQSMFW